MVATERVAKIKLIVCDVVGVLTDGAVVYGTSNAECKAFNVKDGLGIKLASWNNLPVVLLTARHCEAVARRAAELSVQVVQGVTDKDAGLRNVARERALALDEIAYIGDDLNDLPAMRLAGMPVAVADAVEEVKAAALHVTDTRGGRGAVREVIELILKGQGRWEAAVELYLARLHTVAAGSRSPHSAAQ
jgi:3-deoxy-D-manno-octulosonate 8-phosphate phosphatase (KDO 8-P phosphatase)